VEVVRRRFSRCGSSRVVHELHHGRRGAASADSVAPLVRSEILPEEKSMRRSSPGRMRFALRVSKRRKAEVYLMAFEIEQAGE